MIIFLSVLVSVVSVGLCFLSAHFFIKRIEERQTRMMLVIAVSLITAVIMLISTGSVFVPKAASNSLRGGIKLLEDGLENRYPGIGGEVLNKEELREIVEQSRSLRGSIIRSSGGGIIARYVSANCFLRALEHFAEGTESHIDEFDRSGQALTLHNILSYTEAQLQLAVRRAVFYTLLILLGVSVLVNAAVSLFSAAIFKKWLD